jgi:hypothetical protein
VGAVEGYEKRKREGSMDLGPSSAQPPQWTAHTATEEPGSPLREKQAANEKRKRETIDIQSWARGELQPSDRLSRPWSADLEQLEKNVEGLSIFDPPKSSPSTQNKHDESSIIVVEDPKARRKTTSRLNTSSAAPSSSTTSLAGRRSSLQPSASDRNLNRRASMAAANSRGSISTPKDLSADKRSSVVRRSSSSSTLHSHRRESSDTAAGNATNEGSSDVEDGSDYEPTNISLIAETIDSSGSMRATRRKSMVV